MKSKSFQEMSKAELLKQKKNIYALMGFLGGCIIVLLVVKVYSYFVDRETSSIAIPLALFPILIYSQSNLKQINKELSSRGEANQRAK